MTVNFHFLELGWRLFFLFLSWICCFFLSVSYSSELIWLWGWGIWSYDLHFLFLTVSESFTTIFFISFFYSFVWVWPLLVKELFCFLASGLYSHEVNKWKLLKIGVMVPVSFYFNIVFLIPLLLTWSLSLSGVVLDLRLDNYAIMIVSNTFLLMLLGFITYIREFYVRYRSYSVVIILILSGLVTPPDVFSQLFFSSVILILVEMNVLITFLKLRAWRNR